MFGHMFEGHGTFPILTSNKWFVNRFGLCLVTLPATKILKGTHSIRKNILATYGLCIA